MYNRIHTLCLNDAELMHVYTGLKHMQSYYGSDLLMCDTYNDLAATLQTQLEIDRLIKEVERVIEDGIPNKRAN